MMISSPFSPWKNRFKGHHKVFLTFLIVFLISISLVSAFEFDNIKSYDESIGDYGKITIRNSFWLGIPIIELDKVIELELKENSDVCDGFECDAGIPIILYEDGILIDDIRFLHTEKDGTQYYDNLKHQLYIRTDQTKTVDDYEYQCVKGKYIDGIYIEENVTDGYWTRGHYEQTCENVKVGSHQENILEEYKLGDKAKAGNYYIKLNGNLPDIWTTIDWQIKTNGHWINEWAAWTSGLSIDLLSYYNMTNITSTLVKDLVGNANISILRAGGSFPREVNGIIGTAQGNFTNVNTQLNMTDTSFRNLNRNFSMFFWVNMSDACANTGDQHNFFNNGRMIVGFDDVSLGFNAPCHFFIGEDAARVMNTTLLLINDSLFHQLGFNIDNTGGIELYVDGLLNTTGESLTGDLRSNVSNFATNSADGANYSFDEVGVWNRTLSATEVSQLYNFGAALQFNSSSVTLNTPISGSVIIGGNIGFNASADINSGDRITNATLYIWNSTNLDNFTTNFTLETGDFDSFTYNLSANLLIADNYTWNYFICSNQSIGDPCNWAINNNTLGIIGFVENSQTFNINSAQTSTETFSLNISHADSIIPTANLTYNGTVNVGTRTAISSTTESIFNVTFDIPTDTGFGNKSFNWSIAFDSSLSNSSLKQQNVSELVFNLCNSTLIVPYINYSFKNETLSQEIVNATVSSTFEFWLGNGIINKSLSFINATENQAYAFCVTPPDRTLNLLFNVAYNNVISQQRISANTLALTNATTNRTLFLLPSSLGIFSTFKTVDGISNVLAGVLGVITRTLGGVPITVASDTTDSSGIVVYFLNPDITYTGTFSLTGFPINTFTFVPISDTRTVVMGSPGTNITNGTDISLNTSYQTFPINSSLANNTAFTFGLNVTSEQTITLISMNITNSTGQQVGFQSSAGQGFISEVINTQNNSRMQGRFIIQTANETIEFVRVWVVGFDFVGDYSLFRQGTLFLDYEFREFSRLIIVLLIIIGMMAFLTTTQITDTSESQIGAILTLVWIFSIIGWLNNPIVVAETGLAQFSKQYGIAILATAGGSFFILRRLFIRRI